MNREFRSIPVEQLIGQLDQLSLTPEQVAKLRSLKIMVWFPIANKAPSPEAKEFGLELTQRLEELLGRNIITSDLLPGENAETVVIKNIRQAEQIIVLLNRQILNSMGPNIKQLRMMMEKAKNYPEKNLLFIPLVLDETKFPDEFSLLEINSLNVTDPNWWGKLVDRMLERVETGTDLTSSVDAVGLLGGQMRQQFVPDLGGPDYGLSYTPEDRQVDPIEPWQAPPSVASWSASVAEPQPFALREQPTSVPAEPKPEVVGRFVRDQKPELASNQFGYGQPLEQTTERSHPKDSAERADQGGEELQSNMVVMVWYPTTSQGDSPMETKATEIVKILKQNGLKVIGPTEVDKMMMNSSFEEVAKSCDLAFVLFDKQSEQTRGKFQLGFKELLSAQQEIGPKDIFLVPVPVENDSAIPYEVKHMWPLDFINGAFPKLQQLLSGRRDCGDNYWSDN